MEGRVKHIVGILLAVMAAILWPIFSLLTKQIYITSNISPYDMVYFRCLTPLIFTLIYAAVAKVDLLEIKFSISRDMFFRALLWVTTVTLNFISMKIMILSRYTILFSICPIITSILGYFMIGERLTVFDIISCIGSFVGFTIIAANPHGGGAGVQKEAWWAFLVPLTSAFLSSIGDILQRKYASKIHFAVAQTWLYAATMCFVPGISLGIHSCEGTAFAGFPLIAYLYLFLLGCVSSVAITCNIASLKYEKAGRVAAISYLQILNIIVIDAFYFQVEISTLDILAAGIIISCSFTIAVLKAFEVIR